MKQREFTKCVGCNRGVMASRSPMFYRVRFTRMLVNLGAVQRQHGLEMMIGALAGVMGPDEDIAQAVQEEETWLVCMSCAGKPLDQLAEAVKDRAEEDVA